MSGALQAVFQNQRSFVAPPSQQAYTTAGTYSWVAPSGVTKISVVVVGGGGGGNNTGFLGGGGGGLGYRNNITVVPGCSYNVRVGVGGAASASGGYSAWGPCCNPKGFQGVTSAAGGTYTGDGGGDGGNATASHGGGGAGGYAGTGGFGGAGGANGTAGNGGGGGGGGGNVFSQYACASYYSQFYGASGGGGGVGILGQGSNGGGGATGVDGGCYSTGGGGGNNGSGGSNGSSGGNAQPFVIGNGGAGGAYGGGGGGTGLTASYLLPAYCPQVYVSRGTAGAAGGGAVRIIWPGCARSFPSTRTANE